MSVQDLPAQMEVQFVDTIVVDLFNFLPFLDSFAKGCFSYPCVAFLWQMTICSIRCTCTALTLRATSSCAIPALLWDKCINGIYSYYVRLVCMHCTHSESNVPMCNPLVVGQMYNWNLHLLCDIGMLKAVLSERQPC